MRVVKLKDTVNQDRSDEIVHDYHSEADLLGNRLNGQRKVLSTFTPPSSQLPSVTAPEIDDVSGGRCRLVQHGEA